EAGSSPAAGACIASPAMRLAPLLHPGPRLRCGLRFLMRALERFQAQNRLQLSVLSRQKSLSGEVQIFTTRGQLLHKSVEYPRLSVDYSRLKWISWLVFLSCPAIEIKARSE